MLCFQHKVAHYWSLLATLLSLAAAAAAAPSDSITAPSSTSTIMSEQPPELDDATLTAYEQLDKWKECLLDNNLPNNVVRNSNKKPPSRRVYEHNRKRAAGTGFPTRLAVGRSLGLTDHETASIFGWTTGDYRLLNPAARGRGEKKMSMIVEFDEYPFLPHDTTKVTCRLSKEDISPYLAVLTSALYKLPPLNNSQILWRGHRRPIYPSAPGTMVTMDGFTSVTRDRETAIEFAVKSNEGRSKKRTLLCILEHYSARAISKLSARSNEMEVLFPPRRTFEIVDAPKDTKSDDLRAVQNAVEKLQKEIPGAEVEIVYVCEVRDANARSGEGEACHDQDNSQSAGE
mmetsp:Transcript_37533/g.63926  ORF Transcript_37533/g.63926 Transcript_37533/m.63926 type:complete len:344 (+) Transcript_37533:200-1231(+)